jgi:hypothetical protein
MTNEEQFYLAGLWSSWHWATTSSSFTPPLPECKVLATGGGICALWDGLMRSLVTGGVAGIMKNDDMFEVQQEMLVLDVGELGKDEAIAKSQEESKRGVEN